MRPLLSTFSHTWGKSDVRIVLKSADRVLQLLAHKGLTFMEKWRNPLPPLPSSPDLFSMRGGICVRNGIRAIGVKRNIDVAGGN